MSDPLRAQEEALRRQVRDLPDPLRAEYHRLLREQVKDPDTYAALNFLLVAGLHHFYLGKLLRGAINLLIFSAGVMLMILQQWLQGGLALGFILLIELPQLFRSQRIVREHNLGLGERVFNAIRKRRN